MLENIVVLLLLSFTTFVAHRWFPSVIMVNYADMNRDEHRWIDRQFARRGSIHSTMLYSSLAVLPFMLVGGWVRNVSGVAFIVLSGSMIVFSAIDIFKLRAECVRRR